jgi:hypothetical protein
MAYERFKGLDVDTELVRRVGVTLWGILSPKAVVGMVRYYGPLHA